MAYKITNNKQLLKTIIPDKFKCIGIMGGPHCGGHLFIDTPSLIVQQSTISDIKSQNNFACIQPAEV